MSHPVFVHLESHIGPIGRVDREKHLISGVSLIKTGEAKGWDMDVDETTLQQILALFPAKGLKAKVNHRDSSGVMSINGRHINPRITKEDDGHHIRSDWQLSPTRSSSKDILSIAEDQPEDAGISLSLLTTKERGKDERNKMRVHALSSADLVDDPAANSSLLSAPVDNAEQTIMDAELKDHLEKISKGISSLQTSHTELAKRMDNTEKFQTDLTSALSDEDDDEETELETRLAAIRSNRRGNRRATPANTSTDASDAKFKAIETQLSALAATFKTIQQGAVPASGTTNPVGGEGAEKVAKAIELSAAMKELEEAKGLARTNLAAQIARKFGKDWKAQLTELTTKK